MKYFINDSGEVIQASDSTDSIDGFIQLEGAELDNYLIELANEAAIQNEKIEKERLEMENNPIPFTDEQLAIFVSQMQEIQERYNQNNPDADQLVPQKANVYIEDFSVLSPDVKYKIQHDLGITKEDVLKGRYSIEAYGLDDNVDAGVTQSVEFDEYGRFAFWNLWSDADPSSKYYANWQEDTLKIRYSNRFDRDLKNATIVIIKNF